MIALGLGSNHGDRVGYLKHALRLLSRPDSGIRILAVSPIYESEAMLLPNSPADWNLPFLNLAVCAETQLTPRDALTRIKFIESQVGRRARERWAPREIDIDLLTWDALTLQSGDLSIPHPGLFERPFALMPLADLAPDWRDPRHADSPNASQWVRAWRASPESTPFGTRTWTGGSLTRLVGIVNVTPDSFSDGGIALAPEHALEHARRLVRDGATVLDVGAESTRPGAQLLDTTEELNRLEPVLALLRRELPAITLSVDTRKAEVAQSALELGADWINDVGALNDPSLVTAVSNSHAKIVLMHSLGVPPLPNRTIDPALDPVVALLEWFETRLRELEKNHIPRERVICDPGLGFGKTRAQSFEILDRVHEFHALGTALLVGHSRKGFLEPERLPLEREAATQVVSALLAKKGVDYLRVHDILANRQAIEATLRVNGNIRWQRT